jgi:quinoprotein glucose dehydrogenase
VVFPGFDGGGEWGGGSWDPETGYFYVNANDMPWLVRIVKSPPPSDRTDAKSAYQRYCASCHRADLAGAPPEFPALKNLKRPAADIAALIRGGAGRMPAFAMIPEPAALALANYLLAGENARVALPRERLPIDQDYTFDGYRKFVDSEGFPGVKPPWGTLTCYDLAANRILWQIPFGEIPRAMEKGLGITGSENYGGGVATAGGLFFIGATNFDRKFRAFDKRTGRVLWETVLPAAGNATPAVYEAGGRQYVVIGAGGGKWGNPSGGSYVAFRLP